MKKKINKKINEHIDIAAKEALSLVNNKKQVSSSNNNVEMKLKLNSNEEVNM